MKRYIVNEITELVRPAVNDAVTRAIHRSDPDRIHERLRDGMVCPLCPTTREKLEETLRAAVAENLDLDEMAARLKESLEIQDRAST